MKRFLILILCSCVTVIGADIDIRDLKAYTELQNHAHGVIYPFPEKCLEILSSFANEASNLTKCSILNSRPIRLCENCVEQYLQFEKSFQEMLSTVVNGTSCKSIFISHDRLDGVLEFHDSISTVWTKGHCTNCFDWSNPDTVQLSNSTKRFMKMFHDTTDCIVNNLNGNNSEEVCTKCMQSYIQLDEYYKSLSPDAIGVDCICMDIVDSMNATRSIWSKQLNCCQLRRTPEIIFLCCTGIISFLPILYYLVVRFCGPIRDLPEVLRQSRFKQSFQRTIN